MLPVMVQKFLLLLFNRGPNRIIKINCSALVLLTVRRYMAANEFPQNWDQKDGILEMNKDTGEVLVEGLMSK